MLKHSVWLANWILDFRERRYHRFPVVKLLDYARRQAELEASANPFATVVLAHLAAQETRADAPHRAQLKLGLTRRLYRLGYGRQAILDLYAFIDWLLTLPDALETQVWTAIKGFKEEQGMTYITSAVRIGRAEGQRDLVLRLLMRKCGPLSTEHQERIEVLNVDQLTALGEALLDFTSEADLRTWLDQHQESRSHVYNHAPAVSTKRQQEHGSFSWRTKRRKADVSERQRVDKHRSREVS